MNDPTFLFRSLKGRCYGNHFCGQIGDLTFIRNIAIPKRIEQSQIRFKDIK